MSLTTPRRCITKTAGLGALRAFRIEIGERADGRTWAAELDHGDDGCGRGEYVA